MSLDVYLKAPGHVPGIGAERGRPPRDGEGIAKYVSPHGSYRYVAYVGGEAVSALQVVSRDKKHATIANVYTDPGARRQGWASKLLQKARRDFTTVEHAKEEHVSEEAKRWREKVKSAARFKKKKEVDSEGGGKTTVYEYSERQVALRNSEKAKRIEALRGRMGDLRQQVHKDLKSSDPDKFLTSLAVALMDETYERVGNEESAGEGHFGVTGWQKGHVSFSRGKATVSYVGKSDVKQKKVVTTPALVSALRDAYEAVDGEDACLFCHDTGKVDGTKINAYLRKFKVTAKDIRGLHANEEMRKQLKAVRKGALPTDAKERKEQLKAEWDKALEATAKTVGHEASTLKSQYLVPGLEDNFTTSGTIMKRLDKTAAWEDQDVLGTLMAGLSMLLIQTVIVNHPFFDEKEIKRYLKIRRQFHQTFTTACEELADALAGGMYGPVDAGAVQGLKAIGKMGPKQDRQALRRMTRLLRGLQKLDWRTVDEMGGDRRILKIIAYARRVDRHDPINEGEYERPHDYDEFIKQVIKLEEIPAPMRTLLRKALKLKRYDAPSETANPGAWFEMSEQQKAGLRELTNRLQTELSEVHEKYKDDPEKRQQVYRQLGEQLQKVRNVAGVNPKVILREEQEPLDKILRRESKLEADGPTEYIIGRVQAYVEEIGRYKQKETKGKGVPREFGKVLTLLKKARTFPTVERIIKEAIDRNILGRSALEDLQTYFDQANKNRAIREGRQLVPLQWEPKTPEQFQADHDAGDVFVDPDMSDKDRDEMLGRVGRALEDLEGIFGKGFCGKHVKKLDFHFGAATGFASASYFTWDDRNNWQPRVKFGEEYDGLLAHELSHFFEDMLAHKIEQAELASGMKEKPSYGGWGPGDIFGNTGVALDYIAGSEKYREHLGQTLPEIVEFIDTIVDTPDYRRWVDTLSSAYEMILPRAIKTLTGTDVYDLPSDHPYAKALEAKYKSELPPELVEEAERAYREMMDGDVRKLSYLQSGSEVWARMCEQYVYTKLCQAGVANPWLTQLTYDTDVMSQFMDEATFDEQVLPIMDRLFAQLGTKNILTASARRVLARFLEARHSRSKCMSCEAKPTVAYKWADGRGLAWFCKTHGDEWKAAEDREIIKTIEVEGEVPQKLSVTQSKVAASYGRTFKGFRQWKLDVGERGRNWAVALLEAAHGQDPAEKTLIEEAVGLPLLAAGSERAIFDLGRAVLKVAVDDNATASNQREVELWDLSAKHPALRSILVPILSADSSGRWLVMGKARSASPGDLPALPVKLYDVKPSNWGSHEGKRKLLDYSLWSPQQTTSVQRVATRFILGSL